MYWVSVCPHLWLAWLAGFISTMLLPAEEALGVHILDRTDKDVDERKMVLMKGCSTECRQELSHIYAPAYCTSGGCRYCRSSTCKLQRWPSLKPALPPSHKDPAQAAPSALTARHLQADIQTACITDSGGRCLHQQQLQVTQTRRQLPVHYQDQREPLPPHSRGRGQQPPTGHAFSSFIEQAQRSCKPPFASFACGLMDHTCSLGAGVLLLAPASLTPASSWPSGCFLARWSR